MGTSVEVAELAAPEQKPSGPAPSKGRTPFLWLGFEVWIFLLLTVWLYHSILYRLAMQWAKDPDFQHGFFVPAFAAYVIWLNRGHLKRIGTSPSWGGLPIVVFALVMLVLGVLGVELYTSRVSLLVLLAGLVIALRGWPLFQAVLFPWAFSFLMIPLPKIILQQVTFPLQLFASQVSAWILWHILSVPCLREGNQITLPNHAPHLPQHATITLQIVDACSGIRSLMTLITLAIIYGYLLETRKWVRVTLAVAAVPIAIAANIFRIVVTGMLGKWNPNLAEGFYHEFQGWLVFVVALMMLFATHRIINWIWKPGEEFRTKILSPTLMIEDQAETSERVATPRLLAPVTASGVFMLATALALSIVPPSVPLPPHQPLSSLPTRLDNWTSEDEQIDEQTREVLGDGEFLSRNYLNADSRIPWINLFIGFYPTQKAGETPHSPLNCIPGSGFTSLQHDVVMLSGPHGAFPVNRYIVTRGEERDIVLYWFQAHSRVVTDEFLLKYYLVYDSIRLHRSDGALVRFWSPMYKGESPDAAVDRVVPLINQIVPLLDNVIPR